MKSFAPARVRIEKDVIVRIYRRLNGKGVVNVSAGQQVSPEDIIGTSNISPGFRIINLSQALSVSPRDVSKYMQRKLGQKIYKDELLAYRATLLGAKKIVIAPSDGILDFLNPETGELRMTFLSKKEDLPAGVFGICESVDKEKGEVIIRTQVSLVHGIFGSGKTRDGILRKISKRDELISKSQITEKHEGNILLGGSSVFRDTISQAISYGVNGFIVGGMNARDYKSVAGGRITFPKKLENDIGISVVVCEGFGSIPIGLDIYEILAGYDGKFITIDGNKGLISLPSFESESMIRIIKTSLGPLDEKNLVNFDQDSNQILEVALGQRVRIIGNSFLGEQGIVYSVDKSETKLPSGVKTVMATVETKRRKIQVPVANLEVIL